jgi:hypothetical protein
MLLGCGLDCRTSVPNLQGNGQSLLPEERYQGLTQIRMFPQEFHAAGNAAGSHRLRVWRRISRTVSPSAPRHGGRSAAFRYASKTSCRFCRAEALWADSASIDLSRYCNLGADDAPRSAAAHHHNGTRKACKRTSFNFLNQLPSFDFKQELGRLSHCSVCCFLPSLNCVSVCLDANMAGLHRARGLRANSVIRFQGQAARCQLPRD